MSGTVGLAVLATWDVPALQGSSAALAEVPDRLAGWRVRMDGLRAQLRAAELWSGPAADVAATALVELSGAAQQVQLALAGSAAELATVVAEASTAQDEAATARAVAAAGAVVLSDSGAVAPLSTAAMAPDQLAALADRERAARFAEAHARLALAAGDAALLAARRAADALVGVGAVDGVVPPGFDGVAAAVAATAAPPPVPATTDPVLAAAWWEGLTPQARQAVIAADPTAVGALDGLPAWARDQANRLVLDDALADLTGPGYPAARATADALAGLAADGRTAQLLTFDAAQGLVALSTGDLDTAGSVAVMVPGMNTTAADDLPDLVVDARRVTGLAEAAAPGLAVATVVWLGYRTPTMSTALSSTTAVQAGPVLDRALDGLATARADGTAAGGPPAPRTTVLAHSYGTVVTAHAAHSEGELAADAVVVLGSPGMPVLTADGLEAAEVYGAVADDDLVAGTHYYGAGPGDPWFGDTELPTESSQGHSDYYDPGAPTLAAIADVVAGRREIG